MTKLRVQSLSTALLQHKHQILYLKSKSSSLKSNHSKFSETMSLVEVKLIEDMLRAAKREKEAEISGKEENIKESQDPIKWQDFVDML